MRLRSGIDSQRAVAALQEAANTLQQATQVVGGDHAIAWSYVAAVSSAERTLRNAFVDISTERLRTRRFWAINAGESVRLIEMVNDERDAQVGWLNRRREMICNLAQRFPQDQDAAIIDTNVLLHYRLFDEIDWTAIIGADTVRLIVPLRVIDELDLKKAARRNDLRNRARTVLRHLETSIGTEIRNGVTVEAVALAELEPESYRQPPPPADVEILDLCEGITTFIGRDHTRLITGDLAMRIRAKQRDLTVTLMPEELELAPPDNAVAS